MVSRHQLWLTGDGQRVLTSQRLERLVQPVIGIPLPNEQNPNAHIDLRLASLMTDPGLPERLAHNPVNDTTMAALPCVKLRAMAGR